MHSVTTKLYPKALDLARERVVDVLARCRFLPGAREICGTAAFFVALAAAAGAGALRRLGRLQGLRRSVVGRLDGRRARRAGRLRSDVRQARRGLGRIVVFEAHRVVVRLAVVGQVDRPRRAIVVGANFELRRLELMDHHIHGAQVRGGD